MGVAGELEEAQGLLASGDIPGLLRQLRADGGALPLGEVARLVAQAARLAGFDDLAQAAAAAAGDGDGSGPAGCAGAVRLRVRVPGARGRLPGGPAAGPRAGPGAGRPRRCSASSSRPWSRTGSMRAPSPCSRSTSP